MGVEKHLNDARLSKSNSVDLYRPPALRNNSVDDAMRPLELVNSVTTNEHEPNIVSANGQPQNAVTAASPSTPTSAVTSTNNADKQTQQKKETATRRERRPDRAVYVPRARRSQTTPPTATTITASVLPTPTTTETTAAYNQQQLATTSVDQTALVANATLTKTDVNSTITTLSKAKKVKTNNGNKERKERAKKPATSVTTEVSASETINNHNQTSEPTEIIIAETKNSKSSSTTSTSTSTTSIALPTIINCDNGHSDNVLLNPIEPSQEAGTIYPELTEHINNDNMGKKGHNSKSTKTAAVNANTLRIEDVASSEPKCDNDERELQRASKEINRSNRRIMKQTFVSDVLEIPDKIIVNATTENGSKLSTPTTRSLPRPMPDSTTEEEEEDEDDWENMYDETGECLDPKIMEELTASVGKVKIELPKMDYTAYLSKQAILNDEEFPHVLEVSNFPTEFKTPDLLMVFSQYKESGFDIKWVDDTHALAVFSSSSIAAEVLTMGHPFVVLKPLAEATVESRQKAKKCATSLQPYKPRPETCAALARRMVTSALGVRHKASAAERENERRVLREAKERKLLAAKQRDEAWES